MKEQAHVLKCEFKFSMSPVVNAPRSLQCLLWISEECEGLVTDECQARCNIHTTQRLWWMGLQHPQHLFLFSSSSTTFCCHPNPRAEKWPQLMWRHWLHYHKYCKVRGNLHDWLRETPAETNIISQKALQLMMADRYYGWWPPCQQSAAMTNKDNSHRAQLGFELCSQICGFCYWKEMKISHPVMWNMDIETELTHGLFLQRILTLNPNQ